MARKSNKTAHVLNLLAGHDTQPATDETADRKPSAEAEAAPQSEAGEKAAPADSEIASSSAPSQNISVIDRTGEDPVADLIQQKLSAQFDDAVPAETSDDNIEPDKEGVPVSAVPADETVMEAVEHLSSADTAVDTAPDSGIDTATEAFDSSTCAATDSSAKDNASVSDSPEQDLTVTNDTAVHAKPASSETILSAPSAPEQTNTTDSFSMEAASDDVTVPSPEPAPEPAPVSVPTPDPIASVPIPAPDSVPGPGPTSVPKKEPEPASEPEPDFAYVNVMESIVKDKIIYFMRQFDVCTCERCVADTIALTLNGLTPRYIVTSPAAVDPLISYYTNRLISDVTVEATKACMIVKDNPRH